MTTQLPSVASRRRGRAALSALVALLSVAVAGCSDDGSGPQRPIDASAYPIVYMSADGEAFHLWLMKEDGSDPVRLTDMAGTQEFPSWSPDGNRIAYAGSASPNDDYDLYVINADGTEPRQVTDTDDQDEEMPRWSPDGTRLLYVAGTSGQDVAQALVVDADDPGDPQVVAAETVGWPDWSPDGEQILYTGANEARDDQRLWVADADGTQARILEPPGVTTAYEARWSPDGTQIALVAPAGRWDPDDPTQMNEDIWVTAVDGTRAHKVVSSPGNDHWPPAWSPDGHHLLYSADGETNEGEIAVVDLATGNITTLSDNGVYDMAPDWRPVR